MKHDKELESPPPIPETVPLLSNLCLKEREELCALAPEHHSPQIVKFPHQSPSFGYKHFICETVFEM